MVELSPKAMSRLGAAIEQCDFEIQTIDMYGNIRYHLGEDSHFKIEMVGVND